MSKEIIELRPEKPDQGEIRYTYSGRPAFRQGSLQKLIAQVFGIVFGIATFFLLLFFFVYVLLPLIAIFVVWLLARNLLKAR